MGVFRNILVFIFLFSFACSYSQSIDAIKKKNEKTEKEIAYLNKLLENARNDRSATVQKSRSLIKKLLREKR